MSKVEKLQRTWSFWHRAAIINLQDEKMMSSQDGSQCVPLKEKEREKEKEKRAFLRGWQGFAPQ